MRAGSLELLELLKVPLAESPSYLSLEHLANLHVLDPSAGRIRAVTDPRYWTKCVELEINGKLRRIRSTRHAEECLREWPEKQNDAYTEAMRVCRAVLMRGAPRRVAREAFLHAAEEAGIYIRKR